MPRKRRKKEKKRERETGKCIDLLGRKEPVFREERNKNEGEGKTHSESYFLFFTGICKWREISKAARVVKCQGFVSAASHVSLWKKGWKKKEERVFFPLALWQ